MVFVRVVGLNVLRIAFASIKIRVAKANAYITIDRTKHIVQFRAFTNIQPQTEIVLDYQDEFIYPMVN